MKLTFSLGLVALLCVLFTDPAHAQPERAVAPVLELDAAVRIALDRSPEREKLDALLLQRQAERIAAGTIPNPGLSYSREDLRDHDGRYSEWSVSLDYPIFALLLRGARTDAADLDFQSFGAWKSHALTTLVHDVRLQYVRIWKTRTELRALRETEPRLHALERTIAGRAGAGDISPYERSRLRTELSAMQWRIATVAGELHAAEASLSGLLALPLDSLREIELRLPRLDDAATDLETLLAAGREHRSDLAALRTRRMARRKEQERLQWSWIEDIRIGGGFKSQSDAFAGPVISISAPLPVFDRGQGRLRESEAREASVSADLDALDRRVEVEIRTAATDYEQLRRRSHRLLELADAGGTDLLATATEAYREGEFSLVEYLDALSASVQEAELHAAMRAAVLLAAFRLEHAVGISLFPVQK